MPAESKPESFAHQLEWGIRGINPNTYNIADRVFDWFHDRRSEGRREGPMNG
jgi:hypothetical protein